MSRRGTSFLLPVPLDLPKAIVSYARLPLDAPSGPRQQRHPPMHVDELLLDRLLMRQQEPGRGEKCGGVKGGEEIEEIVFVVKGCVREVLSIGCR